MNKLLPSCLYCGKNIRSGRADKKFCDPNCKDAYYNEIKFNEHREIKVIDRILKKNRRILKKLFHPRKELLIDRDVLLKEGFEFDYHTHVVITKIKENQFIFCYDYGYRQLPNKHYKIIRSFNQPAASFRSY